LPKNLFNDNITEIDITKEVKKSFLDYAMSVILSRAIPDIRDGLKPVHRRILYALYDQGMTYGKPHKNQLILLVKLWVNIIPTVILLFIRQW